MAIMMQMRAVSNFGYIVPCVLSLKFSWYKIEVSYQYINQWRYSVIISKKHCQRCQRLCHYVEVYWNA